MSKKNDGKDAERQYEKSIRPRWRDYIVAVFVAIFGWGRRG